MSKIFSIVNPSIIPGGVDLLYSVLSSYNYAALAFSMFYSAVLYMDFYFFRVFLMYKKNYMMHLEARGVHSVQAAWWIWLRYLICLSFFNLAFISPNSLMRTGLLVSYILLLFKYKLPSDIISICYSIPKHPWVSKLSTEIQDYTKVKNINKIKINSWTSPFVILYILFAVLSILVFTIWSLLV
jgi:hypothetical protein